MVRYREMIKIIFSVFLIIVISNIFFGLLEWVNLGFATYSDYYRRLGGINKHPNFYGAFIAYYVCLLGAPFLTGYKKFSAKLLIIPFLLGLRMIIPTNSRGAWIGIPPALWIIGFFRSKTVFVAITVLTIMIIIYPSLLPDTVENRFRGALSLQQSPDIYADAVTGDAGLAGVAIGAGETQSISMQTRVILIKGGLKLMKENPWFGVGWGVFSHRIGDYTHEFTSKRFIQRFGYSLRGTAHNMFLRILCEMGLSALVVLGALLFSFFKAAFYVYYREKDTMLKGMALGYMASIGAIIACNFTGNRFDAVDLISIFWMLSACVLRLKDIIHYERMREIY